MPDANQLVGGIEAGGTKFNLAVGTRDGKVLASHTLLTGRPEATLNAACDWFAAAEPIVALGVATFGPVELDHASARWGRIGSTPKAGWSDYDLVGHIRRRLDVPVAIETDVNGAALAEYHCGVGRGVRSLAYITVGTGIGGGLVMGNAPVHGAAHPEMGHIFPRRTPGDDFAGICPFHGDCLEGLASGPAIAARWGATLSELSSNHPAHDTIADYLAQLCHTLFATTGIERIVIGGGVMQTPSLLDRVRARAAILDAGYLPGGSHHQICAPELGGLSGLTGALLLAPAG